VASINWRISDVVRAFRPKCNMNGGEWYTLHDRLTATDNRGELCFDAVIIVAELMSTSSMYRPYQSSRCT